MHLYPYIVLCLCNSLPYITGNSMCYFPAGLPVFWRHPQNHFVNRRLYTSGVTQVTTHSNGVSSSLILNTTTVANSGKYRCRATSTDGDSATSNEAELLSLSFCS